MIDTYGRNIRYLRLSVTDRCNLRCRYCMPAEGVCKKRHDEMLTEEEIIAAVRAAASLGIDKLRLTGGEPLVKQNILSLCEKSTAVPGIREVCLTTNGTLLPTLAKPLRAAGVQRLNISLDTLNAENMPTSRASARSMRHCAAWKRRSTPGFRISKLTPCSLAALTTTRSPLLPG